MLLISVILGKGGDITKLKQLFYATPATYVILSVLIIMYTYAAYTTCSIVTATLSQTIKHDMLDRTSEYADYLNMKTETVRKSIENLTVRSEIKSMNWTRQKPLLLSEKEHLGLNIQVAGLDGISRCTDGAVRDVSDYDYFKKAKSGITVFEDASIDCKKGERSIICAAPIYQNVRIIGVLSTRVKQADLFRILELKKTGTSESSFIVNRQGAIIAHPKYPSVEFKSDPGDKNFQELLESLKRGESGSGYYTNNGRRNFFVFSPILKTNWTIVTSASAHEIFSDVHKLRIRLIQIFVFTLLLILFVGIILTYYNRQKHKIADLKENADTNARLLNESKELDQLKTDFFANISHEFRTPLSVIHGTLQLLIPYVNNRTEYDKEYILKRLNTIRQNCLRSIRLSNNLIDATKIDAGFYEIHRTNCNIISLVEAITLSVADYIKSKGISVQFDSDVEEKIIACDLDKIERILLNLLANAAKFTNNGGTISVSIHDNDTSVIISVKDTGIGIPPEKTSQIFERFRQVDRSTSRCNEGSGIGLSLVQSFVKMHSGTISISSIPGEGSNFIIELPAGTTQEKDTPECNKYIPDRINYIEKINIEFSDIYM